MPREIPVVLSDHLEYNSEVMVNIEIPDDVLVATGQPRELFVREAKFLLATKLVELGRISSGKAAEMCGMKRVEFLFAASRAGVPVADLDDDESVREFRDD